MKTKDVRANGAFRLLKNLFLICVVALLVAFGWGVTGLSASPHGGSDGDGVRVELGWARPALEGGNGAAYFTLINDGETPVTLIGAEADVAQVVEIHQTVLLSEEEAQELLHGHDQHGHDQHGHDQHGHEQHGDHAHQDHNDHHDHHAHDHGDAGGTFVMLHLDELEVAPKEQVVFGPAGHHVMLIQLTKTLAWDETFSLTLHFEEIPPVTVLVTVGDEPGA